MPGMVKFEDTSWTCPDCGIVNEVRYVSCDGCDEEFETVNTPQSTESKDNDYNAALKVIEEYNKSVTYGHLRKVESLTAWCQERLKHASPNIQD